MPAVSKAQRRLMAIAEHHPSEVSDKNRGVLKMSHEQLHDFAAVKETKMPKYKHEGHSYDHTRPVRKQRSRYS